VRHAKLIGGVLSAALALGAAMTVASSASAAEPEWGRCVAVKAKGHYEDSRCTKEDFKESKSSHEKKYKGKFEWLPGVQVDCVEAKHGRYSDSGCTTEEFKENPKTHEIKYKGKYEQIGNGGPRFEGENVSTITIKISGNACEPVQQGGQTPAERFPRSACPDGDYRQRATKADKVRCETSHVSGEVVSSDEVANVSLRFAGCTSIAFNLPGEVLSTTPGLPLGEIAFGALKGRLGYINRPSHEVGLLLEPVTQPGPIVEYVDAKPTESSFEYAKEFVLGAGDVTEGSFWEAMDAGTPGEPNGHDGVIAAIGPIDSMTGTFEQNYNTEQTERQCTEPACFEPEEETFTNLPRSFEGGRLEALEAYEESVSPPHIAGSDWESADLALQLSDTMAGGPVEIKG